MRKFSLQAVVVALVAGLGVGVAGCGQFNMLKARMALKDAHTAYQQQDYRGAARKYEEAIAADSTQTEAYFYLGNSYDNMYRPTRRGEAANDALLDNAVANYRKAVELEQRPDLKKLALQYLASAYGAEKLNDPAQSEPVVQQLIDMDPSDPINYFALARIYEDSGDYERAEQTLVKAREAKPTEPTVYTTLAAFYNRQGNFDGAIEALQARAEREPNNPEAFYTIATYYWEKAYRDFSLSDAAKMKFVQSGLTSIDKAITLNNQYMEALVYKNLLLRVQANLEKNPARQQALLKEAEQLSNRAEEIRKANVAGAAAAPKGTSGRGGD
ncbi:MAG: tetratricopeptide repeat protein [Acidobacteria bacterium]|nr:tetratricopeptide repeat protein [Acidobacteriota bacterium]